MIDEIRALLKKEGLEVAVAKAEELYRACNFQALEMVLPMLWDADGNHLNLINLQGKLDRCFGNHVRAMNLHMKAKLLAPDDLATRLEFTLAYLEQHKLEAVRAEVEALKSQVSAQEAKLIEVYMQHINGTFKKSNLLIEKLLDQVEPPLKMKLASLRNSNLYQLGDARWMELAHQDFQEAEHLVEYRYWYARALFEQQQYAKVVDLVTHETVHTDFINYHPIALLRWVAAYYLRPGLGFPIKRINKLIGTTRRTDQDALGEVLKLNLELFAQENSNWDADALEALNELFVCPVGEMLDYLISIQDLPHMKKISYYVGCIYLENQGNPRAAIPYFEKAIAKLPEFVLAMQKLILCFEQLGDEESASKWKTQVSMICG